MLGPLLFIIYIDELHENIGSISSFANNIKFGGVVDCEEVFLRL